MSAPRRYTLDPSTQVHGDVVVGGSPLRLFRLTPAGRTLVDRISNGDAVEASGLVDRLLAAGAVHPTIGDGPFTPADVTVVTPALGPPPHTAPGAFVVDDGSQPPIAGAALRLDENRGPAAARNLGLAIVETPLVAFVDGDVTVDDGWLDMLVPHFADERVALVAPRVRARAGTGNLARYETARHPLDLGSAPANVRPGSRVAYVPAAAIVCRVDALREIGGFDTDLRYGEDVDLVWRLVAGGWTCRYEPSAEVLHDQRPTWSTWLRQRVAYGSSAAPLAVRHPGALTPLRTNAWSLASWLLGAFGRPVLGTALATGSSLALVPRLPELPARAALRLAVEGNIRAGEQIAEAVRRAWWPALAVAAIRSRAARRVLVASVAAARSPIRVVDDAAYAVGVWQGVVRERHIGPLVPTVAAWPPRTRHRRATATRYRRTA